MNFIKESAKLTENEKAKIQNSKEQLTLQKHRWVPVTLVERKAVSDDTRTYTFKLPGDKTILGLGTCQHVQIGFHFRDQMVVRSYTPTRPLLPAPRSPSEDSHNEAKEGAEEQERRRSLADGNGTFDLTVKTYFPSEEQPGGALSNILDCMPIGEEIEIRGPTGEIVYNGNGKFVIDGKARSFKRVSLVLGGSGITPGYSLIARILLSRGDTTELRVVDANKSEKDILLRQDLDRFERQSGGQMKITHVLDHPSDQWDGCRGHVNPEIIKGSLFKPEKGSVVFLCGPPAMIEKAALPALRGAYYVFSCCPVWCADVDVSQIGDMSRMRIALASSKDL